MLFPMPPTGDEPVRAFLNFYTVRRQAAPQIRREISPSVRWPMRVSAGEEIVFEKGQGKRSRPAYGILKKTLKVHFYPTTHMPQTASPSQLACDWSNHCRASGSRKCASRLENSVCDTVSSGGEQCYTPQIGGGPWNHWNT